MLWQYVKVLLSEHELEFCDIGEQWSSSGKCFLTVSSSFCEILGGRSHGSEVDLGKLRKDTCKEQLVSKLPIGAVCLQRYFFKV